MGGSKGLLPARRARRCFALLFPLLGLAAVAIAASAADAAHRLVFKNGTSVEVQAYEDLGDSIRYPRLGGTVVVPKDSLAAIEEAVHLPAPTPPPKPASSSAGSPPARPRQWTLPPMLPRIELPQALKLTWQRAGHAALTVQTVRILGAIATVMALIAVVLFFMPAGVKRRELMGGVADGWHPGIAWREKRGRPFGVVLIGIYDIVAGLPLLSFGLWSALVGEFLAELPIFLVPAAAPVALIVVSLAAAGLGAVTLATAYGMCSLQAWGRRLQAALCFIDIPLEAPALFAGRPSAGSLLGVAALLVDGAILVYISRPAVRELYASDDWDMDDASEPEIEEERFTPSL